MNKLPPSLQILIRVVVMIVGVGVLALAHLALSTFAQGAFIAMGLPAALSSMADVLVIVFMVSTGLIALKLFGAFHLSTRVLVVALLFLVVGEVLPVVVVVPAVQYDSVVALIAQELRAVAGGQNVASGAASDVSKNREPNSKRADAKGGASSKEDTLRNDALEKLSSLISPTLPPAGGPAPEGEALTEAWVHGTGKVQNDDVYVFTRVAEGARATVRADVDVESQRAPTAKELSTLATKLQDEVNRVRAEPRVFRRDVERVLSSFTDEKLMTTPSGVRIKTQEGEAAPQDLLDALENQKSMPLLERRRELNQAAMEHARSLGERGAMGHVSKDGLSLGARVRRHAVKAAVGEVIAYGSSNAADIVMALLVDDGIEGRGHRDALLEPQFSEMGSGCAPHRVHDVVCVVILAAPAPTDLAPKGSSTTHSSKKGAR